MKTSRITLLWMILIALAPWPARAQDLEAAQLSARQLLAQPGIRPGIAVHIGCADGALPAALFRNGVQIVHALTTDEALAANVSSNIRSEGFYGQVSVSLWASSKLPYADDLINIIVIDHFEQLQDKKLLASECKRVLAPYGTLFLKADMNNPLLADLAKEGLKLSPVAGAEEAWLVGRKPYPDDMDEWPHYFHDSSHGNVSTDKRVGPATGLRWIQGHYGMVREFHPTQGAILSAGRCFYVRYMEGAQNVERQGGLVRLEAHDAFNGLKLWEREIWTDPSSVLRSRQTGPVVADGELLFCRLERDGEVVALNAATGEVLHRYEIAGAPESCHAGLPIIREDRGAWVVLDPDSGAIKRRFRVKESYGDSPILISDGRVVLLQAGAGETSALYQEDSAQAASDWWKQLRAEERPARGDILCFDFQTGQELWRRPNTGDGRLFWIRNGLIVTRQGNTMNGLSLEDGSHLWNTTVGTKKGGYPALFHFGDVLWGYSDGRWYSAYDPQTGEKLWSDRGRWKEFGRCGTDRATERFILGMDFSIYDLRDQDGTFKEDKNNARDCFFARGDCGPSYYPANGLYYSYGHVCACGVYVNGILGVSCSPLPDLDTLRSEAGTDFREGPAYAKKITPQPATAEDWPTFRRDAWRSAATTNKIDPAIETLWRTPLAARPTAPVAVGDAVFTACPDAHQVLCLDAKDGNIRWTFTAGGRVDSPPTWHQGLLLFGARDGWAYCLKADDGALVWKRRVAPADQLISVRGQLESSWPLYGAVLVESNLAYVSAGRHGDADGGVFFQALEPATGKVVWERNIKGFPPYRDDPHIRLIEGRKEIPHSGYDAGKLSALDPKMLAGIGFSFRNDVLISDGQTIFLSAIGLDPADGTVTGAPTGVALFNQSGDLITDSDLTTNKTKWTLIGNPDAPSWRSRRGAKTVAQGRLLSMDGSTIVSSDGRNLNLGGSKNRLDDSVYPFALVAAGDHVLVACRDNSTNEAPAGKLLVFAKTGGALLEEKDIDIVPAFDGMAVAQGRVFIAGDDASLLCMAQKAPTAATLPMKEDIKPEEPAKQARRVAILLPSSDARAELLSNPALSTAEADDLLSALKNDGIGLIVANADPATLQILDENSKELDKYHARGGWIMLWGLEPEGLDRFNRVIGFNHLLRPYEIERVRLPDQADPLLEGVVARDLDFTTQEKFGHVGQNWPDPDAYGYVVDIDDIAPFCTWPEPAHFRCPGQPKSDRWPRNMVNGMWEFWKGAFVMDLRLGTPTSWTLALPRRETVRGISIIPGFGYAKIRQLRVGFGPEHPSQLLNVLPEHTRQSFDLTPTATEQVEITISDWEPSAANPLIGVDNLWIQVERDAAFHEKVKPLASIGVLVKYPRNAGGIVLNQIKVRDAAAIEAMAKKGGEDSGIDQQALSALRNQKKRQKDLVQKLVHNLVHLP